MKQIRRRVRDEIKRGETSAGEQEAQNAGEKSVNCPFRHSERLQPGNEEYCVEIGAQPNFKKETNTISSIHEDSLTSH